MPADTRKRGFLNIRIRPRTHDTLKAIASARGMQLIDLIDELAEQYHPLVDPLRQINGHTHAPPRS